MSRPLVASAAEPGRVAPPPPPSFSDGVRVLVAGVRFIASRRDCWPAAAVPCLVVAAIAMALCWLTIGSLGPWLADWLLPRADSWYARGAHAIVLVAASVLGVFASFWVALLGAPILSAPALEHLVRAQEGALGVPGRPRLGVWFELWCGLEAQLGGLLLALPLWLVYWIAGVLLPGAAIVLLPFQILPLALSLAWSLLDYPLTLRGVRARSRFALLRQQPAPILGFGLCFAAATFIPGAAFLLLPAGVVAATRLAWRLIPETLPE
jgi:uncharacterized protein involved in cysteine biosynthesis